MRAEESAQRRAEVAHAERGRARHPHQAAQLHVGFAQRLFQRLEFLHQRERARVVQAAGFGQAHAPGGAGQQRRPEVLLEVVHALGDQRLRQPQLARRLGETLEFGHAQEGPDGGEVVQSFTPSERGIRTVPDYPATRRGLDWAPLNRSARARASAPAAPDPIARITSNPSPNRSSRMRKSPFLAIALALAFVAAPALAAERYNLDPMHTQVRFHWNHFGYSNMSAAFGEVKADLQLDTADLTQVHGRGRDPDRVAVLGRAQARRSSRRARISSTPRSSRSRPSRARRWSRPASARSRSRAT